MFPKTTLVDIKQTTALLNVSEATLRNWVKQSFILPDTNAGHVVFNAAEILRIRTGLLDGTINKLKSRANKKNIVSAFIPSEYLSDKNDTSSLVSIINISKGLNLSLQEALFVVTVKVLIAQGWIKNTDFKKVMLLDAACCKHSMLRLELNAWLQQIPPHQLSSFYHLIRGIELPLSNDILGLVYQSLLSEGDKSQQGSYYTPAEIVNDVVDTYIQNASSRVHILDPCCGSGQFLLQAITKTNKMNRKLSISGYDIDPVAVRLARINILVAEKGADCQHYIYHKNFLLEDEGAHKNQFDLIISNPPWGAHFSAYETGILKSIYPGLSSMESFSYFIEKGLSLLKPNGILSFILPESILHVKAHKDIRKVILDNSCIEQIICLDRAFKKIFTPVIRLDIRKRKNVRHFVSVKTAKSNYVILQDRFSSNTNYEFDILNTEEDNKIITKVYGTLHTTLKGNADWALGIVTGDNDKYISEIPLPGYEKLIRGSDIKPYGFKETCCYIKFDPSTLQQVAPEHKYRAAEKLVYKFISNGLVLAYDNKQTLCLNSANCIIPKANHYPVKVILALFNSKLYQYIFAKKFSTIKILRNHLEELPLPLWDNFTMQLISRHADRLLSGDLSEDARMEEMRLLDIFIMQNFGLTESEIESVYRK